MNSSPGTLSGIAIVGMAGRFPKAPNLETFWANLRKGVEAISFFSEEELANSGLQFPANNPLYVKARGVLDDAAMFDASFFGINPKEAEILDPQHRVFLECAWEALERAGYDPEREPGLIGVFAGMSMNTYLPANLLARPGLADLVGSYALMLANDKDYLPTRVSYKLNLRGPSVNVQTGCSTSLVAVCMACQHLLTYQCDMALAGGVSISFPQKRGHLYQEGSILSPDGHCRAFDRQARGTVAGEGVGIVVLKRLADAVEAGDQIYAVIKGFAVNNDGAAKGGYTAPSESGQAECIALAQAMAGVPPESIGYIEAHGTGTPLGDPIEVSGLTRAFRAGTSGVNFCALGSVKTHVGHLDAAAGIAGLINATLAIHHGEIPPTLHYREANPKIEFSKSPFYVNTRLAKWPADLKPRRAGVSSFGIGGTNAHVILEEAPPGPVSGSSSPAHLLLVSAKTPASLEAATTNLSNFFRQNKTINLADAARTLQVGRRHFKWRRAVVARDVGSAIELLARPEPTIPLSSLEGFGQARLVFMFPGQGAQRINMGRDIYAAEPVFRQAVDEAVAILHPLLGLDLRPLIYPEADQESWATEQLRQTKYTQPALFLIEYALAKLWMSWGVRPAAMIGHSLGEYVAACLAGVLSLSDALRLVVNRAHLMQQQPPGSMLAVRLPEAEATAWGQEPISLAAVNGPAACVLSGPPGPMAALRDELNTKGIASHQLDTSHAFHSGMMEPVTSHLREAAMAMSLHSPTIPYISNLTGQWITAEQAKNPEYYASHLRHTVRFATGAATLRREGYGIYLEVGPGQALGSFVRQHGAENVSVLTSLHHGQTGETDFSVLLTTLGRLWVAGLPVDWSTFQKHERRRRVCLPTYPFERKRYWMEPLVQSPAVIDGAVREVHTATELPPTPVLPASEGNVPQPDQGSADPLLAQLSSRLSELSGLSSKELHPNRNFVELGFDSLFLSQVSVMVENHFHVRVPFADLLAKFPNLNALCEFVRKAQVLSNSEPTAKAQVRPEVFPLTAAQMEIWFAVQRGDAAAASFNQSAVFRLVGQLDLAALEKAFRSLISRHEALRLVFSPDGETQRVLPAQGLDFQTIDLSGSSGNLRDGAVNHALTEAAARAFDMTKGPLLRVVLIKLTDAEYILELVVHHIICDGGSLGVLLQELGEFYAAEVKQALPPSGTPQSFSDFVRSQSSLPRAQSERAEAFWIAQHSPPAAPLKLPTIQGSSASPSWRGRSVGLLIERELLDQLKQLSTTRNCTLFSTLLCAYTVLLHRLSGQTDLNIGLPVTRRAGCGSERLVGHCVNFLPVRFGIDPGQSLAAHLEHVKSQVLALHEHADCTLGTLLAKVNRRRNAFHAPLASVMFNLDWIRSPLRLANITSELLPAPAIAVPFELSFNAGEFEGLLQLVCQYRTELFEAEAVSVWLESYRAILSAMVGSPEQTVEALDLPLPFISVLPGILAASGNELPNSANEAPQNPTEEVLGRIWSEVIGLGQVNRDDDFFDLGGHSVLLTQVVTRVRKTFGVNLTLRDVFESPTVASLAAVIEQEMLKELENMPEEEAETLAAHLESSVPPPA